MNAELSVNVDAAVNTDALTNAIDRGVVNALQKGLALGDRPYANAAGELGLSEAEVLGRVRRLVQAGVVSRVGPLYDAERMGGAFMLAALSAPEADFDRIAAAVNAHPEVAHNYAREHALNMWFVLATERAQDMAPALDRIARASGCEILAMPRLRQYALRLELDACPSRTNAPSAWHTKQARHDSVAEGWCFDPGVEPRLDPVDRRLVVATQAGLPLVEQPFHELAATLGIPTVEVLARFALLQARGMVRRIALVPNHYALGYRANGMAVWDVEDACVDALGERIARLPGVSHCYRRVRHPPRWPYNLFVMLHGRQRATVRAQAAAIDALLGVAAHAHDILFSTRILKKSGLRLGPAAESA